MYSHLTEVEKAYIAGIIDGEGHISLFNVKGRIGLRYMLGVDNTDFKVIEWLSRKLKCTKIYAFPVNYGRNQKPRYRVYIAHKNKLKELLIVLEPYFIIKKKRAQLMIEFLENSKCKQGLQNHILSPREIEIHNEMRLLNKKGVY